ncbi:Uncharacterised protein [BD1-7 clade bacterium]|uniref:NnrS protein n=1 Tax=BD1-7 clade bacterium TaxID=2029982 RepID=A0A5S9QXV3_9GAMM|nr:Uncharacterised protein [BD1-7 clade bacterium]
MYLSIEGSRVHRVQDWPLWELAFRPGFLLASAWSVVSLTLWVLYLTVDPLFLASSPLSALLWHVHEMLFGFAATVAISFLLTASQTWTGQRSLHGKCLIMLTLLWIAIRVCLLYPSGIAIMLAILATFAWWAIAIASFTVQIEAANNSRNRVFIPVLVAMMLLDIGFLLAAVYNDMAAALILARACVLVIGLLIGLVGGRVIPFFTQRAIPGYAIDPWPGLDVAVMLVSISGAVVFVLTNLIDLGLNPAWLMFVAGFLHLVRQMHWLKPGVMVQVLKNPLLWSLHLANFALGFGLLLLGFSYFLASLPFAIALHLIAVGSIGAMILSMMSRVSLGHTGRPLKVSPVMVFAFVGIFVGALVRAGLALAGHDQNAWVISAGFWIIAFVCFLIVYTPILFSPRLGSR